MTPPLGERVWIFHSGGLRRLNFEPAIFKDKFIILQLCFRREPSGLEFLSAFQLGFVQAIFFFSQL